MAVTTPTIDIESDVFALRLANLLRATRLEQGRSLRALAKASGGRFTRDELRQIEAGGNALTEDQVQALSEMYAADLGTILPSRLPVAITSGVISAGGVTATFVATNSTSLLTAYLRLIRAMRRQQKAPMIVLRREDIEVIADFLDEPGETIVDRLTALMGATLTQRTAMATMFATGAIVIGLAGSSSARAPETAPSTIPRSDRGVEVVTDTPAPVDSAVITTTATADAPVPASAGGTTTADSTASTTTPAATVSTVSTVSTAAPATGGSRTVVTTADPTATTSAPVATPSPDDTSVADSAPAPTVVDSGGVVIPDLPYGDAIVIDDPTDTTATPAPPVVGADTPPTLPPVVGADTPPTLPPDVATDAPPVPSSIDAPIVPVVGEVPVVTEVDAEPVVVTDPPSLTADTGPGDTETASTEGAPRAVHSTTPTRAGAKAEARRAKHERKATARIDAKVAQITTKAEIAIERKTNKVYIEADEERVAALKVIYGRADSALAKASMRIFANGATPKANETFASVKQEIEARADDDKDAALDWIYGRADAEKGAIVAVIEARAAAARATLGRL